MSRKSDPFSELEELFDEFVGLRPSMEQEPAVDVIDADEEVLVVVDLPGRDAENIDVTLEESRRLTVAAGVREAGEDIPADGRYVQRERGDEGVSRSIRLPADVDEDDTEANYEQGVLTVRLPKRTSDDEGTEIPVN